MNGSLTDRAVSPELLDNLPPDAPEARASRRDLRRINGIMGQARIMVRALRLHVPHQPRRIVELGCGDGFATLAIARKMAPAWPGAELTMVDLQPVVPQEVLAEIGALGWSVEVVTADVFDWLEGARGYDLALANLFLHHFEDGALERLLAGIAASASTLVATEPHRAPFAHLAARSVGAIGANHVTRHDAAVSVRAGFRGSELTPLWPAGPKEVLYEGRRGLFTHVFAARSKVAR